MESAPNASQAWELNAKALNQELDWLARVLQYRIEHTSSAPIHEILPPPDAVEGSYYWEFIRNQGMGIPERLLCIVSLAPYLRPELLQVLGTRSPSGQTRPELGGFQGMAYPGFLPTLETALLLIAGKDLEQRLGWLEILRDSLLLIKDHWLELVHLHRHEPPTAALLVPGREMLQWISSGELGTPEFGVEFPAEQISTNRGWEELVLPSETARDVEEILDWIKYEHRIMEQLGLREKVAPGYRSLFYGPPGTGKTFTASLLGKVTGRPVFRIDLSQVVSKYIGETEKNLRNVFDQAEQRKWILFFDEADALFGKRTSISDSKDRFANQEVSYLLQRMERHDGMVILATNHRDNLDKAFTRRFQLVVHFPMPGPHERLQLWQHSIPKKCKIDEDISLEDLAQRYEISGGSIMNVMRYCVLQAARRESDVIELQDFIEGIRREYRKVGRILK